MVFELLAYKGFKADIKPQSRKIKAKRIKEQGVMILRTSISRYLPSLGINPVVVP